MPYLPLKLPPGIWKNGTKYQAKGRWFDASLVRWREGAMLPMGGWQRLERTVTIDWLAAIADDGGVFTDETTEASNATTNDMTLLPATPAEDDAYYFGAQFQFTTVNITIGTAASDGTITWEYYNGSSWVALSNVTDNTNSFQNTGNNNVTWDQPGNWSSTTVNSQGPHFYVRARVSTAGTSQALGTQSWTGASPIDLNNPIRGMHTWTDNSGRANLAFGTRTALWGYREGAQELITPTSFTSGLTHSSYGVGAYGDSTYGQGAYGEGNLAQGTLTEAHTWQIDNFGQIMVACSYSDGRIVQWDLSIPGQAAAVTNAPTSCLGVVVTPERFLVALGASGDPRAVAWSDQEDMTVWTPSATNQAGDFPLSSDSGIMAGKRGRNETLIWTETDLWSMRYIGGTLVYQFGQLGSSCGAIGRLAMAMVDGRAFWMGQRSFFMYDGAVRKIPSEVSDHIFGDFNRIQRHQVACVPMAQHNQVFWYYPSANSEENDRYAAYNYIEGHWTIGELQRTSGVDRGAWSLPLAADGRGAIYEHEIGTEYLDTDDATALVPFAESGPIEIAQGDQVMMVRQIIPDDDTLGDVTAKIITALYPTATETTSATITLANPTSLRQTGRQVRLRVDQVNGNWRLGVPRLEVVPGGLR